MFKHLLALALGKTIREMTTGEPGMDAKEFASWRRFYRLHPFGLLRGDLQAWLTARNVGELFGGGLRPPGRAQLGLSKRPPVKRAAAVKTAVTREMLESFSRQIGVPFTPGEGQ